MVIAGQVDQSRVKEYLYGPLFEVEVHDRDRIIHKFEEGKALFGEEHDDDLLSIPNTGLHLYVISLFSCIVCREFVPCSQLGISCSVQNTY